MADSLAPEIVQGKGHGLPADWYNINIIRVQYLVDQLFYLVCMKNHELIGKACNLTSSVNINLVSWILMQ